MLSLLALLIVVGTIGGVMLAGYGFGTLGRIGFRAADRQVRLRCFAAVLGAGAVGMYTWGMLHLAGAALDAGDGGTGSSPVVPCVLSDRGGEAADVVDYSVSLLPLRFVCETTDGEDFAAGTVPGYVNPAVPAFVLPALACAATAAIRNARAQPTLWPDGGSRRDGV